MGNVILPSGSTCWVDDMKTSYHLSQLIEDAANVDYCVSYRISVIATLGRLGSNASCALPALKRICDFKNNDGYEEVLHESIRTAIKKIEKGNPTTSTTNNYEITSSSSSSSSVKIKRELTKVEFVDISNEPLKGYSCCNFCGHPVNTTEQQRKFSKLVTGTDRYYCNFCIRNDYFQRSSDIMIMSFKGLFSYYYYAYYIVPRINSMNVVDICEMADLHIKVGYQNVLFKYDVDSFNWFVDFSKVGRVPVQNVLNTIAGILTCFNIYEAVPKCSPLKFFNQFKEAVLCFNEKRIRMNDEMVFVPTLYGCGIPTNTEKNISVDALKGFLAFDKQRKS